MLEDLEAAPLPETEKALLAFVDKVNRQPSEVRREDVDALKAAGWTDEAIYDAVTVCALFNFYNRWIDGTGVQGMAEDAYQMMGQRIAESGYGASTDASDPGSTHPDRAESG